MGNNIIVKRIYMYLTLMYTFLFISWLAILISKDSYIIVWALFSIFPVVATAVTKRITNDKSPWLLKPDFKKNKKVYVFSAFVGSIAIFFGALLFFLLFPNDLDLSGRYIVENYAKFGAPADLQLTVSAVLTVGMVAIFVSPLILPVHLFALGEEIGWRGYLLPLLMQITSVRKAVLWHGVFWGMAHGVLIYFGFNYSMNYWGAPYSGMLMMVLVCIVLGVLLAYVTIRSKSILPATLLHGTANVIGELPVMFSLVSVSPLLGPNPTGIIGLSGLIIVAGLLIVRLPKISD